MEFWMDFFGVMKQQQIVIYQQKSYDFNKKIVEISATKIVILHDFTSFWLKQQTW